MTERKRDAFLFYRSYFEAIENLPHKDQLAILKAIASYALNDEEVEMVGVPSAVFMLIKPTLDANKRRSERGKAGGEAKAAKAAKAKAASKQNASSEKDVAIKDKGQEIKDEGQETWDEGQEKNPALSAAQTDGGGCPFDKIRQQFHEICVSFPRIRSIDGERRKAVAARWRNDPSMEHFAELFRLAEASSFLKGQNDRNWHADFDWLMKATNFAKVLEHKYDNAPVHIPSAAGSYFSDPSAYENMTPL